MKSALFSSLLATILAGLFPTPSRADSVAVQWEKRYNGPANGQDRVEALTVDASGNVIVTGFSATLSAESDYHTVKYAAADGSLVWEKSYNGPFNRADRAHSVAVDSAGNVIVTGGSTPITTGTRRLDYYTAKYAAADGALLWERRYDGPVDGNGDDEARLVAVDSEDNVIVTGNSSSSGTEDIYDFYTAKYAAANGALLWERRYNGPNNSSDVTTGLAVDGAGNVIVTGYFWRSYEPLNRDFYTAKYAASNGALL